MDFVKVAKTFKFAAIKKSKNNDFFADRLSHRITNNLLLIFILLSTFRRFYLSPINCWVPAELSRYAQYMQTYCWLKGTYYVDQSYDHNMLTITARNESLLKYYQWVYLFLCLQALLFYLPRCVWSFITQKIFDFDLFNMVDAAKKYEVYKADKPRILKYLKAALTRNYSKYLTIKQFNIAHKVEEKISKIDENEKDKLINSELKKEHTSVEDSVLKFARFRFSSGLITMTYILIKCLYILVSLIQIGVMNSYLSSNKHTYYGSEVFHSIISGTNEVNNTDSKIFPRITICDVRTKELGTHHTYTIQCVLSFNLFNERIYAFLWFWIFFVLLPYTVTDLVAWLVRLVIRGTSYRYKFIKSRIQIYERIKTERQKFLLRLFTEYYVGVDGCFTLRLLEHNSNASVVSELINEMWKQFKIEQKH